MILRTLGRLAWILVPPLVLELVRDQLRERRRRQIRAEYKKETEERLRNGYEPHETPRPPLPELPRVDF